MSLQARNKGEIPVWDVSNASEEQSVVLELSGGDAWEYTRSLGDSHRRHPNGYGNPGLLSGLRVLHSQYLWSMPADLKQLIFLPCEARAFEWKHVVSGNVFGQRLWGRSRFRKVSALCRASGLHGKLRNTSVVSEGA